MSQEIDRLVAERDAARSVLRKLVGGMGDSEVSWLKEALLKYGNHTGECLMEKIENWKVPCICGFLDVLARIHEPSEKA